MQLTQDGVTAHAVRAAELRLERALRTVRAIRFRWHSRGQDLTAALAAVLSARTELEALAPGKTAPGKTGGQASDGCDPAPR